MSREISTRTAARLLAGSIDRFDNAGISRDTRRAPAVPGIGTTICLLLLAAAIWAFAL